MTEPEIVTECNETPSEPQPKEDGIDVIESEIRATLLRTVRVALIRAADNLSAANAPRVLKLVEHVCEHERKLLAYLNGAVEVPRRRKRALTLGQGTYVPYDTGDDESEEFDPAAIGTSEPDGETFGAQAIKSFLDTITGAVGALSKPRAASSLPLPPPLPPAAWDEQFKLLIAQDRVRAAELLADNELLARERAALRALLESSLQPEPLAPSADEHSGRQDWLDAGAWTDGTDNQDAEIPVGTHVRVKDVHVGIALSGDRAAARLALVGREGVVHPYAADYGLRPIPTRPGWLRGAIAFPDGSRICAEGVGTDPITALKVQVFVGEEEKP